MKGVGLGAREADSAVLGPSAPSHLGGVSPLFLLDHGHCRNADGRGGLSRLYMIAAGCLF